MTEWRDKVNPADYSTIVSKGDSQAGTGSTALFSSGILPACIIKAGTDYDYDSVLLSAEAALYAGTTRIIFTTSDKNPVIAEIINSVYRPGQKPVSENTLVYGYIKTTLPETYNAEKTAEKEYRLYTENLGRLELSPARVHLAKWYSLRGEIVKRQYTVNLWLLGILAGDYAKSADVINSMKPAGPEDESSAALMNICHMLYTGKVEQAREAYNKIPGNGISSADAEFISIILDLAEKGDASALKRAAAIKTPYNTIIPADRYLFLLLPYSLLISDDAAKEAAALIPPVVTASERERLLLLAFTAERLYPGHRSGSTGLQRFPLAALPV